MPSVYLLSLGCFKNLVDSEGILADLAARGFDIVFDHGSADAVVINTCGFIDPAKEESIEAILEAVEEKKAGRVKLIAAVGCMIELWKDELKREIPEVDIWLGLSEMHRLCEEMSMRLCAPSETSRKQTGPRMLITPAHVSYLKISEGCSHCCTFCLIPRIRGPFRSRGIKELTGEAQFLEDQGVKEINIIAQDTASYGRDRGESGGLAGLLKELLARNSIPWYRLLYLHPESIDDRLIEVVASESRILNYLDLPFQHISDKILKGMGRRQTSDQIYSLLQRIRKDIPGVALRTTLLVGFPGEGDEDFERLIEFVRDVRFDWMGAFVFSPQEGTRAAALPDQVPQDVARDRYEVLLDTQQEINRELNLERLERTETVLVDEVLDRQGSEYIGRTTYQAYEIDGFCILRGHFQPGRFARARITDCLDYDLIGEKAE